MGNRAGHHQEFEFIGLVSENLGQKITCFLYSKS